MHDAANLSHRSWTRIQRGLRGVAVLMRPLAILVIALLAVSASLAAQPAAELIAAGDRESQARQPARALPYFERAVSAEPRNTAALWRAARELVDLGEYERNERTRSELYARAVDYARRAIASDPADADAHFHLARAIGRTALSVGPRDRVKYGIEVRAEALRALELAPKHPGALHVMGVWNAEVMRLNGFSRLMAKTFLGGKVFESASWAEATRYMELAVAVEPTRLVHRLDLARVYRDTGRKAAAREAYAAAIGLAAMDANDEQYRREAQTELAALGR